MGYLVYQAYNEVILGVAFLHSCTPTLFRACPRGGPGLKVEPRASPRRAHMDCTGSLRGMIVGRSRGQVQGGGLARSLTLKIHCLSLLGGDLLLGLVSVLHASTIIGNGLNLQRFELQSTTLWPVPVLCPPLWFCLRNGLDMSQAIWSCSHGHSHRVNLPLHLFWPLSGTFRSAEGRVLYCLLTGKKSWHMVLKVVMRCQQSLPGGKRERERERERKERGERKQREKREEKRREERDSIPHSSSSSSSSRRVVVDIYVLKRLLLYHHHHL